jgi:hypothetical protein
MRQINEHMKSVMDKQIKQTKQPDAKKHLEWSIAKSCIRIAACGAGIFGMYDVAFIGLLLAELVGIKEELV